jgi:hypothetical protein
MENTAMRYGLACSLAVLTTVTALGVAGSASALDTLRPVHFQSGHTSITLDGALVRGDSDIWSFAANAGQTADIAVTALEDNASFVVFQPPASVSHGDDGLDVDGTMLPGTDSGDAKHWSGKLPATGAYYIEVSGDRGNASYKLTISIQ